jgi:26S proteasome regulatory subunit N2
MGMTNHTVHVYTYLAVACGCLPAGGRNATLGLRSASGYFRRTSVVGLAVFTGYWYWYPLR